MNHSVECKKQWWRNQYNQGSGLDANEKEEEEEICICYFPSILKLWYNMCTYISICGWLLSRQFT